MLQARRNVLILDAVWGNIDWSSIKYLGKFFFQSRPKIGGDSDTPETPETPSSTGLVLDIVVTCYMPIIYRKKVRKSSQLNKCHGIFY